MFKRWRAKAVGSHVMLPHISMSPARALARANFLGSMRRWNDITHTTVKDLDEVFAAEEAEAAAVVERQRVDATALDLEAAVESAELVLAGERPNRTEASALIDHLEALRAEGQAPSAKQLRWIEDMAKKAGLDEAAAAALIDLTSFEELTGGKGGTASALIDALKPLVPRKGAKAKG